MNRLLMKIKKGLEKDYYKYWGLRLEELKEKGLKVGQNVHILDSIVDEGFIKLIQIGDNVIITGATILAHDASTKKFIGYTKCGGVHIGNNVFVGHGAIILPNTKIGNNVIIGAGAVVKGDIPDDSVVVGNPMVIIGTVSENMRKNKELFERYGVSNLNDPNDIEKMKDTEYKGFVL